MGGQGGKIRFPRMHFGSKKREEGGSTKSLIFSCAMPMHRESERESEREREREMERGLTARHASD